MRKIYLLPAISWFIILTILLCLPGSAIPSCRFLAVIHADKWVHISSFFLLCLLFDFHIWKSKHRPAQQKRYFIIITVSALLYGTGMEFVQKYWVPDRSFELADILADATGAMTALGYAWKRFTSGRSAKKLVPMEIGTATKTNCL